MNQKLIFAFLLIFVFSFFPLVSADIIIPTVTKVYFEQGGAHYGEAIKFTVKGYGYYEGMPRERNYNPDREEGTYVPEVVFSFSADYTDYGGEINENYYQNYLHIDYYEINGENSKGELFLIENIENIPTSCAEGNFDERACELRVNLDDAIWNYLPPAPEPKSFFGKIGCFFKKLFGGPC